MILGAVRPNTRAGPTPTFTYQDYMFTVHLEQEPNRAVVLKPFDWLLDGVCVCVCASRTLAWSSPSFLPASLATAPPHQVPQNMAKGGLTRRGLEGAGCKPERNSGPGARTDSQLG